MNTATDTNRSRKRRRTTPVACLAAASISAAAMTGAMLAAVSTSAHGSSPSGTTVQMSVTTGGFAPGNGANNDGNGAERRQVSADGRYVVLAASGPVVPGQKPIEWQIVRRDRHLGTTTLVSRSSAGAAGNARSGAPSISANGQVVAFHSYASNLVAGDTNNQSDIFVHDMRTGKTTRASVTTAGQQVSTSVGTNIVGPPSISADGRYVGFTAVPQGLAAGDTANANAYLHDRVASTTEVVGRSHLGLVTDVTTGSAVSVSADGRVVAFHSGSSSVVAGDGNGDPDVFVRDRVAGTTKMVPGGEHGSDRHTLSADGRFVAFESASDTLVSGDTNAKTDVFVLDRTSMTTTRVSVATAGVQANGHSSHASISSDGRYVTFQSEASNVVSGDTNGQPDVFRHDRATGQTIRISLTARGAQNSQDAEYASVSGNGQHVTFESYSRTLTGVDTRGYGQTFVRDLGGVWGALHARIGTLPTRVNRNTNHTAKVVDVRTGPALVVTWTPRSGTKGRAVRQSVPVRGTTFTLRSPGTWGSYNVTVQYAGHLVGGRTITVLRPSAQKLPTKLKVRKKLAVRTVGVNPRTKIRVTFAPSRSTKGKTVRRTAAVNQKGIAKVTPPRARGTYRVVVRSKGVVLRKGVVRIR